jgi:hypothetical protein
VSRVNELMIEKFYASHIKTRLDAAAINIYAQKEGGQGGRQGTSHWNLALY